MSKRLQRALTRAAPATSGRLSEPGFLLVGAAAGLLGWGGTQLLAWVDRPSAALLAAGLWAALMTGFVGLTVFHAPAAVRFSAPMLGWGTVNGSASVLTVVGLAGLVPPRPAFWTAWVAAAAVGYCWTGGLLVRAEEPTRGWSYLAAGVLAVCVLVLGTCSFTLLAPVAFLLLTALHAVPLTLDARTALSPVARAGVLAAVLLALLGVAVAR